MVTSIDCSKQWTFILPDILPPQEYQATPEAIEDSKVKFTIPYGDGRDGMTLILDPIDEKQTKTIKATYKSFDSLQSGKINFTVSEQGNLLKGSPQDFPGTMLWQLKAKISDSSPQKKPFPKCDLL